ncbi:MAG: aminomethyltransferase beta-barrel domain-containing protein, partial [Anaerolineaceae bacterium]|nr:aminomethyltransferase beta-barrel domain-containing protein [Anaerolineaceae bacterium]
RVELLQGRDVNKDQSYVLSALTGAQLMQTLLPLGDYLKTEVRALAKRFELPVAEKPDSQDLCFLGSEDYRDFLVRHEPCLAKPGPIVSVSGELIGEHQGLAFYTIGQRKGLGIAAAQPMYVIDKEQRHNTLIVGAKETLGRSEMTVMDPNWVSSSPPAELFRAEVKIRYKAAPAWATVTVINGAKLHVQFDRPLRDITPGQYAVFYHGERVLGGGVIHGAL